MSRMGRRCQNTMDEVVTKRNRRPAHRSDLPAQLPKIVTAYRIYTVSTSRHVIGLTSFHCAASSIAPNSGVRKEEHLALAISLHETQVSSGNQGSDMRSDRRDSPRRDHGFSRGFLALRADHSRNESTTSAMTTTGVDIIQIRPVKLPSNEAL